MIITSVLKSTNAIPSNPVYSKNGDVLVPASDTTPTGLARASCLEKSGVLLGGDINIIRPRQGINGSCLSLAINHNKRQLIRLIKGTTVKHIHNSDLSTVVVALPKNLDEQREIVNTFKNLDNLITLHQRKPKLLCSSQNFYLVSEYAHPWEQRKFDDVFNYLAHNSLSRDDLNDNEGSIKNIHYGDVLIKFGNVIDTKHEYIPYVNDNVKLENKACFLQDGDVVIADAAEDSTVGKCTEISESSDQKIVSGLHTIPCRPKNKFAKGFLGYYLNSNAYHDQLLPLMQGTKVSSISKTSLKETTIKFPSSIEEQKKVGACFHELDNLITLHQR